jgi:sugar lactone lactonase YvrE
MHHRLRLLTLLVLVLSAIAPRPVLVSARNQLAVTASAPAVQPLPRGCGGVTGPGETTAACCVSGFVYVDGQPVSGAEVQIEDQYGNQVTLITQPYDGTDTHPYYRVSLSAPPLRVQAGETITVTARYGGVQRSLTEQVRAGGQQVDIVLARPHAEGYVFERQIQGQAELRQFNDLRGVALDDDGNIYVVDSGNARVQVFGSDKQLLGYWGTLGGLPGQFRNPTGITLDDSRNVYVVDAGNARIQKFSHSGRFITAWGSYGPADGQLLSPTGIAADGLGNLYVADGPRVQKFSSSGAWLNTWDRLPTSSVDISVDPAGAIYLLGERFLYKFDRDGNRLASWEGLFNVADPDLPDFPTALSATGTTIYVAAGSWIYTFSATLQPLLSWNTQPLGFYRSAGVAADRYGYLYVADETNSRMLKFRLTVDGGYVFASWGDRGRANGQFDLPLGIAAYSGSVYVVDQGNNRIQVFDEHGGWLATWGATGDAPGQFSDPGGIAVDSAGSVYVADTDNHRIQRRDPTGNWSTLGEFGHAPGQFWWPADVSVDAADNLYVYDRGNERIQRRDPAGAWSVLDLGESLRGHAIGRFASSPAGELYVADRSSRRMQRRDLAGNWDVWGSYGDADGQVITPIAISFDDHGNVYVGDQQNGRIQKFTRDGVWLTTFGGIGHDAGEFGTLSGALLGLAIAENDTLFVSDTSNDRVQIFRPMTYTRPIATVHYLASTTIAADGSLVAFGAGQDSDETPTIAAYRWTSDRDGVLGTSATLDISAARLSPGAHHLSFAVRDGEGEWSEPVGFDVYVAASPQAPWTMLLYLAGDYADGGRLLNAFNQTLDKLRRSFRNPSFRIAIQLDGPQQGDTVRLLITPGGVSSSPQVATLPYGEQRMDDPVTLADFVRWGQSSFPASHYYLSIANHGQAVQGIAWDTTSDPGGGANLTVRELGQALNAPGVAPIDVLQLDACSMNTLEVAYELGGEQVGILVASQYLGWDYFAYDHYQAAIAATTDARALAIGITSRYATLAHADGVPYTIAALDLRRLSPAMAALDRLAAELTALSDNHQISPTTLASLWAASQHVESNGDYLNNQLDMYIDLADWTRQVYEHVPSPAVRAAAAALLAELSGPQPLVIVSRAESNPLPPQYAGGAYVDLHGSSGLSIFYPRRQDTAAFQRYLGNQIFSFTSVSRWPEFLAAGNGVLCPGCALQPLPGPLAPLASTYRVFLPFSARS